MNKVAFINDLFTNACLKNGLSQTEIDDLLHELSTKELNPVLIRYTYSLINEPEKNSLIAGAILTRSIYMKAPLFLKDYAETFRENLREDVYNFIQEHFEVLQEMLNYENNFSMHLFSVRTAVSSYLARLQYDEEPLELIEMMWMRVAIGQFCSHEDALSNIQATYKIYSEQKAVPASPTLFNMGFKKGAPISCALYTIADDLEDIFDVLKETAMASKNNAGLGTDFSQLRHSAIGRHGKSSGIIPLIKLWDSSVIYVNQGGRRPGAMTASLRDCHYDFPEFIRLVDKVGEEETRVKKLNTAIFMSDLFYKRLKIPNSTWSLFCPHQTGNLMDLYGEEFEKEYVKYENLAKIWKDYMKYQSLKNLLQYGELSKENAALYNTLHGTFATSPEPRRVDSRIFSTASLMKELTTMQCKYSMPYVAHGCNINRKNAMQNVGPTRSLNLCMEITIPAVAKKETGCCILSSINLGKFAKGSFDYEEFGSVVRQVVRCLNCVIDETRNISDKLKASNLNSRPIGLGVNGFGDMANILRIPVSDPLSLPKAIGIDADGEAIYEYKSYTDQQPDYTEDALAERKLNPELMKLNWLIWCCMYYNALKESCALAQKYGPYPNFWTSQAAEGRLQYHLWQEEQKSTGRNYNFSLIPHEPQDWGQTGSWAQLILDIKTYGLRNAMLLTCMPTASSASLLNTTESTEFHTSNLYSRKVQSGDFPVLNYHCYRELKRLGVWNENTYNLICQNKGSILSIPETGLSEKTKIELRYAKEMFLTMYEIRPSMIINLAAQRQVVIDHSQSTNFYISHPTPEMMEAIHSYSNECGLKTGMYYLRTDGATEPLPVVEKKAFAGEIQDFELNKLKDTEKTIKNKEKEKIQNEKNILIKETNAGLEQPMVCKKEAGCISCQ